jgi:RNA polymerase sigma factor (TIGR02999 family)
MGLSLMTAPDPIQPAGSTGASPATGGGHPLVTQLLEQAHKGSAQATNELFPIVYEELRTLAARFLHNERDAQTLQATALVNEAYLRLVGPSQAPWESRAHFFGAAATAIRRILIDHARTKTRDKRGGGRKPVSLDQAELISTEEPERLIDFDAALEKLAAIDPQKARVVELRFFAGLTVEQTAISLGVSPSTVARDWQFGRVWLFNELRSSGDAAP